MTRECAVNSIIEHIHKKIIKVGNNSAKIIKSTKVFLPVGGIDGDSVKLKDKKSTNSWAKRIAKESNDYFKAKFFGNVVEIDNVSSNDGTYVNLNIKSKLVDHYVEKEGKLYSKYVNENENNNLSNYFSTRTEKSVDILNKINKSNTVWNKLALYLIPFAEKNNVTLQLDDVEYYDVNGKKAAAYYDSKTNRINIAGKMNVNENMAVRTLLHEILHSLTHSELSTNNQAAIHMKALFQYSKANLKNKDMYPLTNVDEFIVGLFENGEFIEELKKIPAMGGIKKFDNLFEEIIDFILNILGLKKGESLYEQAFSVASHIITEQSKKDIKEGSGVFAMESKEPNFKLDYIKERIKTLKYGEKSYSVRPDKQLTGVYKLGNNYYRVSRLNEELKTANDFPNIKDIKKSHLNNEDKAIYSHIQDFYDNKIGMYVYEIEKLSKKPVNEKINNATDYKFSNRKKLDIEQEVYFTRLINDLNKKIKANKKILEYEPYNDKVNAQYNANVLELDKVRKSFDEYKATNNRQLLVDLGNDLLDKVDAYVTEIENDIANNNITVNAKELIENIKILRAFEEFTPLKTRVGELFERINPSTSRNSLESPKISIISLYALELAKKATGNENLKLSDMDIESSQVNDINMFEKWVGSLAEVENYLAKSVGYLIKTKHAEIIRDNNKSFNDLKPIVDGIKKYADKNGISVDKVFEMFTQTSKVLHKGNYVETLILVKPFSENFYSKLREANKLPKSEQTRVKLEFAKFNTIDKRWEPKDKKDWNNNYTTIQKNKELKDFYNFWQTTMKDISEKIPLQNGVNFIPNIAEQTLLDIIKSGNTFGEKFKDIIENITKIHDASNNPDVYIDDENLLKDEIPMRYTKPLSPDLKSKRLDVVLLTFMQFANNYNHMSEILPMVRTLEEEIKNKQFIKDSSSNLSVSGQDSNIYKMVKDVIEMQVKGKMKKDEKLAPYIDFGLRYTSLLRIGLNPFNALTNVFIGSIGNIIEGIGGRYYTVGEFTKAQSMFFTQINDKNSLVNKLTDLFNPLQEMEDYENLSNIKVGSKDYRESIKSIMYAPQRLGEKMMQTSTMLAHLMNTKVTTKDGKTISMIDGFTQEGKWNTELMGYELTNEMIDNTTNKIHRINQMIHGRYSAKVAATAQQYSLFRAAAQFKKWIPAAIEARLQSYRIDHTLGYEIEGRYLTAKRVFIDEIIKGNILIALENLIGPLLYKAKMIEKGELSEMEIYNMRKNLAEIIIIAASLLLMAGLDDDDKDKKSKMWYKFTMSQLNRISGDLLFFYSPTDMSKSIGIPMVKTINDVSKAIRYMPYAFGAEEIMPDLYKDPEYKSGPRKGENKAIASLIDIIPGIKQFADIYRMSKKVPLQEFK